jgi:hypothetical protein
MGYSQLVTFPRPDGNLYRHRVKNTSPWRKSFRGTTGKSLQRLEKRGVSGLARQLQTNRTRHAYAGPTPSHPTSA